MMNELEALGRMIFVVRLWSHAHMRLKDPIRKMAERMNTGVVVAKRKSCRRREASLRRFLDPKVRWLSADDLPIMRIELSIDMSPVVDTSLAHRETMITNTSCIADSLLLSVIVAFSESFFISGLCTKRATSLTVKSEAADITARLKKMGLE